MAKRYWVPDANADENVELGSLMDIATAALRSEDKTVAGLIEMAGATEPESASRHSANGAGRGLSYWVYETTLVYIVWRAWMKEGKATALDWSGAQLEGAAATRSKDGGKSYDLVVFSAKPRHGFVFEAKRWNYSPDAMTTAIRADANKLRKMPRELPLLEDPQRYILLFWYKGPDTRDDRKLLQLASFCKEASLAPAGKATFPAWLWRGKTQLRGSFVLSALKVLSGQTHC
jgi:hypothetical protein